MAGRIPCAIFPRVRQRLLTGMPANYPSVPNDIIGGTMIPLHSNSSVCNDAAQRTVIDGILFHFFGHGAWSRLRAFLVSAAMRSPLCICIIWLLHVWVAFGSPASGPKDEAISLAAYHWLTAVSFDALANYVGALLRSSLIQACAFGSVCGTLWALETVVRRIATEHGSAQGSAHQN